MEHFLKGKGGKTTDGSSSSKSSKSQSKGSEKSVSTPWVEKYRPQTVDDIAQQDEVVAVLKKVLQGADLPNLLFYGPPGTGKTSTILAMARELFGDMFRNRILELNASDERGIQVVREKVRNFAQQTASSTRPDGRPCPPLKIIILDEADSMTSSAQAALRRIMEKESKTTRFCLICNYISRIIEPLTSRCAKFRFKQLNREVLVGRLREICEKEDVKCGEKALLMLISTSEGDLRKAITSLQSAHRLKGRREILEEDVCEIVGVVPANCIDSLLQLCRTSNSYEKLEQFVQVSFMAEGFAANQIFNQLHDKIVASPDVKDGVKSIICETLAVAEHKLVEGADEYLQLMVVCTTVMQNLQQ